MLKQKIHNHLRKKLQRHIEKHGYKKIQKIHHYYHHMGHIAIHLGEMIVAVLVGIVFILGVHASPTLLPVNSQLFYPLSDVAKLECRPNYWPDVSKDCITKLPIIHHANFQKYINEREYRFNYTVLWRGTYQDGWDQDKGAHPGVDIASVKGTPLYAIANGQVYYAGWQNGYGNVVKIRFRYKGKNYYAVYGHTNKVYVKKGQIVNAGQQIAEIGNTGMTIGGAGGYHVHFEINKEKNGRLEYYLTGCPDKSVGDFGIVDKGLCRKEIGEHQVDPIVFLESAGAGLVPTNNALKLKTEMVKETREQDAVTEGKKEDIHPSAEENKKVSDKSEKDYKLLSQDQVKKGKNNNEKVAEEINDQKEKIETKKVSDIKKEENYGKDVEQEKKEEITEKPLSEIKIDIDGLLQTGYLAPITFTNGDAMVEHILQQYDIKIYSSFINSGVPIQGEGHKIIITVKDKETGENFDGVLPFPIKLMTANSKTELNYNQVALVKDGKIVIDVNLIEQGESAIVFTLRDERLAVLKYIIE